MSYLVDVHNLDGRQLASFDMATLKNQDVKIILDGPRLDGINTPECHTYIVGLVT